MTEPKPFLVGGKWRTSGEFTEVSFPFNGDVVARVCQAGGKDLDDALASAVTGFETTRQLPSHARSQILRNLHALMEKRSPELIDTLVLEGGKARKVAVAELERARETIRISAEEALRIGGEIVTMDRTEAGENRHGFLRRFPLGPVLGISPFNYPLMLSCHKLGPAIAAGNSFLLKPPSSTPLSGLLLGEMVLEAGYPPGAISVLVCPGPRAERLVSDPRVAFFTFTGSSEVGWHLRDIAGRKRIGLELGGNAAAIVHEDADLEYTVGRIAMGGFTNAGQSCISVQRVLVHRPVYDKVLSMLLEAIRALKAGDPREADTDVGPMIDKKAAAGALAKVRAAVREGAQVRLGGERDGAFFQPTVLTETTPQMEVNREEIFAPVITVAMYEDFEEAVRMADSTDFGLQSGIFTQDIRRIMHAFENLRVGGLLVNDVSTFRVDQMPYGGVKGSGMGKEGPRYAIEEMTEARLMVLNLSR